MVEKKVRNEGGRWCRDEVVPSPEVWEIALISSFRASVAEVVFVQMRKERVVGLQVLDRTKKIAERHEAVQYAPL